MSIQKVPQQSTEQIPFALLNRSKVALLTTFRRDGQGVETPVGIKLAGGHAYFTTWSTTGKVKRLTRNPQVRLASFTKWGMKVIGPTVEGTARRLDMAEVEKLSTLFKTGLRSRMWDLIYRLRGWQKVHYEVSPSNA